MRPSPSVEIGRGISSPISASALWSRASSTVHSASGSSTVSTTFLTMKASNLPLSRSRWARTGSLIRCCFLAAEAIASSRAEIHRSRSMSFSRATWRRISFRFSSAVCAWGMAMFLSSKTALQLDLQPSQLHVAQRQLPDLAGPAVLQQHLGLLLGLLFGAAQPLEARHVGPLRAGLGVLVGDPREAAGEALVVPRLVELPVETRGGDFKDVPAGAEVQHVEQRRDLPRDVLAVGQRHPFGLVHEQPEDAPLELGVHQLTAGRLRDSFDLGCDLRDTAGSGGHVLDLGLLALLGLWVPAQQKKWAHTHFLPTVAGQGKLATSL